MPSPAVSVYVAKSTDGRGMLRTQSAAAPFVQLPEGYSSWLSFGLSVPHFFILITWLFSVRRSTRAAVR